LRLGCQNDCRKHQHDISLLFVPSFPEHVARAVNRC
jgi:hypothetical protein